MCKHRQHARVDASLSFYCFIFRSQVTWCGDSKHVIHVDLSTVRNSLPYGNLQRIKYARYVVSALVLVLIPRCKKKGVKCRSSITVTSPCHCVCHVL